jgi:type IV secretion system protein VirB10
MNEEKPTDEARIQDRTLKPSGVIPKNAQAWVLGTIALIMVVIIFFSGGSKRPKESRSTDAQPAGVPASPNPATIDDFVNRMDDRTRKLAQLNAALEKEQKEIVPASRSAAVGSNNDSPPAAGGYRPAENGRAVASRSPTAVEQDRREAQAPYASNIALSYRTTPPPTVGPGFSNPASANTPPRSPNILDIFNRDATLASVAATQFGAAANRSPFGVSATPSSPPPVAKETRSLPETNSNAQEKQYTLYEGTLIETALVNRLNATFSGPAVSIVTTDVYSSNGKHVLIPRGSRVIGEVRQVDNLGQQRVAVSFHRILLPNGRPIDLDHFIGLNQIGETGLRDQVNHHYSQIFGAAIAVGAIAGLAQANTQYGSNITAEDVYRQGVASSLSQSSMRILDRFLNILPTFSIREGHRIKIYLSQDLALPEYVEESGR